MFIQAIEQNVLQSLGFKSNKSAEQRLSKFEEAQRFGVVCELQCTIKTLKNTTRVELCKQIKREAEIRLLSVMTIL